MAKARCRHANQPGGRRKAWSCCKRRATAGGNAVGRQHPASPCRSHAEPLRRQPSSATSCMIHSTGPIRCRGHSDVPTRDSGTPKHPRGAFDRVPPKSRILAGSARWVLMVADTRDHTGRCQAWCRSLAKAIPSRSDRRTADGDCDRAEIVAPQLDLRLRTRATASPAQAVLRCAPMSTDDHGAARDAIGSSAPSRRSASNVRDPIMTPRGVRAGGSRLRRRPVVWFSANQPSRRAEVIPW